MAKGRFVSKQITIDKRVNDLKDPWSMLGFTWMIPHADCEGRLYGDPAVLKSIIFPRQNGNITVEYMESLAISWQNAGLIIYYEDDNDRYIQLVNFEKHQTGLRKDREPGSEIPGFNPDNFRIIDGKKRVKLSKVKLSKGISETNSEIHEPTLEPCDMDGIPDSWKDKPKLSKKKERENIHPAIKAYNSVTKKYPNKLLYEDVIEKLGASPDIKFMTECYKNWIGRGYNQASINWLDWYKNGIPKKGIAIPEKKIYTDPYGNKVEA